MAVEGRAVGAASRLLMAGADQKGGYLPTRTTFPHTQPSSGNSRVLRGSELKSPSGIWKVRFLVWKADGELALWLRAPVLAKDLPGFYSQHPRGASPGVGGSGRSDGMLQRGSAKAESYGSPDVCGEARMGNVENDLYGYKKQVTIRR